MPTRTPCRGTFVSALVVASLCSLAWSEPHAATKPPAATPPTPRSDAPEAPDALKERLTRRIEVSRSILKRTQQALDNLNAGGDPTEIRRTLDVQLGRGPTDGQRSRSHTDAQAFPPVPGDDAAPPQGGRHGAPLTPDERERIRAVLARVRPTLLQSIDSANESNPALAERTFIAMSGRLRGLDELEKTNPPLFELRLDETENGLAIMRQTKALFEAHLAADAAALDRERTTMRALLARQFDLRARSQTIQVEQLETKLAKMKAELAQTASRRDAIVERRLHEMLDRSEQANSKRPRPESKP